MALGVFNCHSLAHSQHSLSLGGALATKRANRRQHAPKKDDAREKKTARDEQRQTVSPGAIFIAAVCDIRNQAGRCSLG